MSAPSTNRAPFVFVFPKIILFWPCGLEDEVVFFTTSWGCIYNFLAKKPEKTNHHDSIVMDHCLNPTMGIPSSWETCSRETASSEEKTARYQAIGVHWPDFRCPIVLGQVLKGWRCCPPTGFLMAMANLAAKRVAWKFRGIEVVMRGQDGDSRYLMGIVHGKAVEDIFSK